jgi:hypothetical protein
LLITIVTLLLINRLLILLRGLLRNFALGFAASRAIGC